MSVFVASYYEHGMPCALDINSKSGLKQKHEESYRSTTKNIITPLNACGHQTWQGDELPWGAPTCKFIWPFDYMVLQDHMTN